MLSPMAKSLALPLLAGVLVLAATCWFVRDMPATLAAVLGGACLLALLLLALLAKRRWLSVPFATLVCWIGLETFAAPHWVNALALVEYHYIRDVDHHPQGGGPSWNRHSLRGALEPEEYTEETFNLLFLGDSFTYGMKVKPGQAFPALVGRRLGSRFPDAQVRVANFGWVSSSPLLSYRRLRDIGDDYAPDLVVLCLDMTDPADDIRWGNMLERRGAYALYARLPIAVHLAAELFPDTFARVVAWSVDGPVDRYFFVDKPLEESRAHLHPLVTNIGRIHTWCEERGADFALVVLPRSFQHSDKECPNNWEADEYEVLGPYSLEIFRFFDELRSEVQYPIISLLQTFQRTKEFPVCFDDDPHWTPAGHRVAAEALVNVLSSYLPE